MALGVYEYDEATNAFVPISSGTQLNPVTTAHNGSEGQTVARKLFLRNDNLAVWYNGITIRPISTPDDYVSADNTFGWEVKVLGGDTEPSAGDWSFQTSGAAISSTPSLGAASPRRHFLPEIGSALGGNDDYYPFWAQVVVPRGTRRQVQVGISLRVLATENVV